jgi:hypothetical protein
MFFVSFEVEKLKIKELKVSRKAETESKNFSFKHFHDSPKRFFYFRVVSEFVFHFCLFVKFARNHFQPAKERSQQKANLVFLYSNRKSPFPKFRSLHVIVAKAKSPILSFKICEELSAVQKPKKEPIRDNKTCLFMS